MDTTPGLAFSTTIDSAIPCSPGTTRAASDASRCTITAEPASIAASASTSHPPSTQTNPAGHSPVGHPLPV